MVSSIFDIQAARLKQLPKSVTDAGVRLVGFKPRAPDNDHKPLHKYGTFL